MILFGALVYLTKRKVWAGRALSVAQTLMHLTMGALSAHCR